LLSWPHSCAGRSNQLLWGVVLSQSTFHLVTDANSSRVGMFFVTVCLFFSDNIAITSAVRITKLDIQMFRDESWKAICFGVKRSKVNVTILVVFRQNGILLLLLLCM